MLFCVACQCGSVEMLVQAKLIGCGHTHPFDVPIYKGRERGHSQINASPIPQEVKNVINQYINSRSKYAVIVCDNGKWVDVANGTAVKNEVELSLMVEHFA